MGAPSPLAIPPEPKQNAAINSGGHRAQGGETMGLVHAVMSETTFWTILLMIHGLVSMALIGALTHQAASVLRAPKASGDGFAARFSGVKGEVYASAVTGLWVVSFLFGAWIYVKYRTYVRIPIEQEEFWKTLGAFELKEQLVSVGLGVLPLYWIVWRRSHDKSLHAERKWLTLVLAMFGWIAFLVGHLVNNVRGFGS